MDEKKALMAATLDEGRTLEWGEPRVDERAEDEVQVETLLAILGEDA